MQACARTADLAGGQRHGDQGAHIVRAVHVLRHAHAPEDDRLRRSGIKPCDLAQGFRVDAADRRHGFRREFGDLRLQRFEAVHVGGDVLPVVELFGDDHVEEGVQHRHVGAGLEHKTVVRVAHQFLPARIHDDQLHAILRRLLDIGGGDRMVLFRPGADHDHAIRIERRVEWGGHRAGADPFHQGGHGGGVAKTGTVVDVIGGKALADQLLEQIGFLVGALGRAEAGDARTAPGLEACLQAGSRPVQRLVPGRLAEDFAPVLRIERHVAVLGRIVEADERFRQAFRA